MSTSSIRDQLLESFRTSEDYRHAFVEEKVRTGVAAQIRAIRERQQMDQKEFAKKLRKATSWVYRLEDPNEAVPTISTLLDVAKALDVDLEVRFGSFSELLDRLTRLSSDTLSVPKFNDDPGFIERKGPKSESRKHEEVTIFSMSSDTGTYGTMPEGIEVAPYVPPLEPVATSRNNVIEMPSVAPRELGDRIRV